MRLDASIRSVRSLCTTERLTFLESRKTELGVDVPRGDAGTKGILILAACLLTTLPSVPAISKGRKHHCDRYEATIIGTHRDDVIRGTDGDDVIVSRGGDDVIHSGRGSDTICAGGGSDLVRTGRGDYDFVRVGGGDDRVWGGRSFQDAVYAGSGDDVVRGGPGRNLMIAGPGSDRMIGGRLYDFFSAGRKRDWRPDKDVFLGRGSQDEFSADPGDDIFNGGRGRDRAYYFDSPTGVVVNLTNGTSRGDGRDRLISIENLVGSRHDDRLTGTSGPNDIFASTGDDEVFGLAGDDFLYDSDGKDHFDGGGGDDFVGTSGCVSSEDYTDCQSDQPLPDRVIGGPGNDTLGAGPGPDELTGGAGDDRMWGGDGIDEIQGRAGDDTLWGGNAAGPDPEADDGDVDRLDGGDDTDACGEPQSGDERINCESFILPAPTFRSGANFFWADLGTPWSPSGHFIPKSGFGSPWRGWSPPTLLREGKPRYPWGREEAAPSSDLAPGLPLGGGESTR